MFDCSLRLAPSVEGLPWLHRSYVSPSLWIRKFSVIKKEENDDLRIHLSLNPDILFDLGQKKTHQFLVGFAAETNDVIAHGRNKMERKNLDMLIANDVAMPGAGFNVTTNIAAILYKDGTLQQYPKMSKEELGKIIIEKIAEKCNWLFNKRRHPVLELRKS